MPEHHGDEMLTRQERRGRRLDKKKEKMPQHSRGLSRLYKQAVERRVTQLRSDKDRLEERKGD